MCADGGKRNRKKKIDSNSHKNIRLPRLHVWGVNATTSNYQRLALLENVGPFYLHNGTRISKAGGNNHNPECVRTKKPEEKHKGRHRHRQCSRWQHRQKAGNMAAIIFRLLASFGWAGVWLALRCFAWTFDVDPPFSAFCSTTGAQHPVNIWVENKVKHRNGVEN